MSSKSKVKQEVLIKAEPSAESVQTETSENKKSSKRSDKKRQGEAEDKTTSKKIKSEAVHTNESKSNSTASLFAKSSTTPSSSSSSSSTTTSASSSSSSTSSNENTASFAFKGVITQKAQMDSSSQAAPQVAVISAEARALSLQYLRTWKNNRNTWKFQKNRQVFLLAHCYDKAILSKNDFKIFLEYIQELKGAGRTRMIEEARTILQEYEVFRELQAAGEVKVSDAQASDANNNEDEQDESKLKKRKAQRAQQVLEVLA